MMLFFLSFILLFKTFGVISFHNNGLQYLSDIISSSVDYDFSENRKIQDTVHTPYVQSLSNEMEMMDAGRTKEDILDSGPIRIFLPSNANVDRIDVKQRLTFVIPDLPNVNVSLAHLVINETERIYGQIRVKTGVNTYTRAVRTDIGYIADVTKVLRLPSTTFQLLSEAFSFQQKPLNVILTIYENYSESDILDIKYFIFKTRKRRKRSENNEEVYSREVTDTITAVPDRSPTLDPNICSVKPWIADIDVIGWEWWLNPKRFQANVCKGVCPNSFIAQDYYNSTNHALIKSNYHIHTGLRDTSVSGICCTPIKYAPQTILYEKYGEIILKTLTDMKVVTCGCR